MMESVYLNPNIVLNSHLKLIHLDLWLWAGEKSDRIEGLMKRPGRDPIIQNISSEHFWMSNK